MVGQRSDRGPTAYRQTSDRRPTVRQSDSSDRAPTVRHRTNIGTVLNAPTAPTESDRGSDRLRQLSSDRASDRPPTGSDRPLTAPTALTTPAQLWRRRVGVGEAVQGRDLEQAAPRGRRCAFDGQLGARHEWLAVSAEFSTTASGQRCFAIVSSCDLAASEP